MKVRLTNEEVRQLIIQAQKGVPSKLEELYEAFSDFRDNLTNSFYGKGVDIDDIAQEVDYSFILAVKSYDPNKGDSPILHIISRTRRLVSNYYNKEIKYKSETMPVPVVYSIEELICYLDVNEEVLDIKNEMKKLSELEKGVVYYHFILGLTQTETANELGVSQSTIHRIALKVKNKNIFKKHE